MYFPVYHCALFSSYCCIWNVCIFKVQATTDIYPYAHPLSLHDALPIYSRIGRFARRQAPGQRTGRSGFSRELLPLPGNPERIAAEAAPARAPSGRGEAGSGVVRVLVAGARALDLQRRVVDGEPLVELDMKSVVSGKSVSVRVDFGVRSII